MVSEVEKQINACIDSKNDFVLDAGAGSGKTWTLVQALSHILNTKGAEFKANGQRIVCITYTNVAKDEIIERTEHNELLLVSTIHDFLWECIKRFQTELKIKLVELLQEKLSKSQGDLATLGHRAVKTREKVEAKISRYTEAIARLTANSPKIRYDNYSNYKEGRFSHDALIIIAERIFAGYPRIKKIICDTYPIILVDEYQDTQKETIKILLSHLKGTPNFTLGFFGDKQQQIYDKGIGEIPAEYDLQVIKKTENYRSSKEVIVLLNKIRNDIQQHQPPQNTLRGETLFFLTNISGDFNAQDFIRRHLLHKWDTQSIDDFKILYLTHRYIAKENGYEGLYQLHSGVTDALTKNEDNRGICPHTDFLFDIEEIAEFYKTGRTQLLLKNILFKVHSFDSKSKLDGILKKLIDMRATATIKDIFDYVTSNRLLPLSKGIEQYDLEDPDKRAFYEKLISINYSQFLTLYKVQQDKTPFSTKHSTKGAEFDNVLVVIDDSSWRQSYNFDSYFSGDTSNEERYRRTRNLFYVVCSRARKNLAIVCTSALSDKSKTQIQDWFSSTNYIEV